MEWQCKIPFRQHIKNLTTNQTKPFIFIPVVSDINGLAWLAIISLPSLHNYYTKLRLVSISNLKKNSQAQASVIPICNTIKLLLLSTCFIKNFFKLILEIFEIFWQPHQNHLRLRRNGIDFPSPSRKNE